MIHVLGIGSIGRLIGHALRRNRIATTFLVRAESLKNYHPNWELRVHNFWSQPPQIERSTGYLFDSTSSQVPLPMIRTLLVCTKAHDVTGAINCLRSRIDEDTHIVLLTNGIGVAHELRQLFHDKAGPTISHGLTSHGAYSPDLYTTIHAGWGEIVLAASEERASDTLASVAAHLSTLSSRQVAVKEFHKAQLTKLIVNVCINPITAITGLRNGSMMHEQQALISALIDEALPILKKSFPEIVLKRCEVLKTVQHVIQITKDNTSSMLQDIQANRRTEIDYINGAIVRLGQGHDLVARYNQALVSMIKDLARAESDLVERGNIEARLSQLSERAKLEHRKTS